LNDICLYVSNNAASFEFSAITAACITEGVLNCRTNVYDNTLFYTVVNIRQNSTRFNNVVIGSIVVIIMMIIEKAKWTLELDGYNLYL